MSVETKITRSLNCLQINIQHSSAASASLSQIILDLDVDIVFLQEPYFLNNSDKLANVPPGYHFCHVPGTSNFYSSAIIFKRTLPLSNNPELSSPQVAVVGLPFETGFVQLVSMYCRPSEQNLSMTLDPLLTHPSFHVKSSIICMDSNAHHPLWNSNYEDPKGRELEEVLAAHPLQIANQKHVENSNLYLKTTYVDLTLAGDNILEFIRGWKYLDMPSLSDHPFIFFSIDVTPSKKINSPDWMPPLLQIDVLKMKAMLHSMLPPVVTLTNIQEIDTATNNLTDCIRRCAKSCFIRPTFSLKKKNYWWSNFLCSLRSKLRKSQGQLRKNPTCENENIFKADKAKYQREIRAAKFNSWKLFCEKDLSNDPFKAVKKLNLAQRPRHEISKLRIANEDISSTPEILKAFAEAFFPSDVPPTLKLPPDDELTIDFFELTEVEVKAAITSLRPNSAPGIDGIGTALLQEIFSTIQGYIFEIYRASLRLQYFPLCWRRGKVVIIPKPGKENYEHVGSYRPICLLPTLGKIFEKVILTRLNHFATMNCWLSPNQHGFVKGKSTITAVSELTEDIEKAFHKKVFTACLFLDIKGAFDNACHGSIIDILASKKCPSYLTNLVSSFLSNRTVNLNLGTHNLEVKTLKGCPQGSLLSPFLWNLIADTAFSLPFNAGVKLRGYADNLWMYKSSGNLASLQSNLEEGYKIFVDWATRLKLEIAKDKLSVMLFNRRRISTNGFKLSLGDRDVYPSTAIQHLGFTLDPILHWKLHIEKKCLKAKKTIFFLRRISKLTWGPNMKILKRLYEAIVEPMILYGAPIWSHCLLKMYNRNCLRLVQRLMTTTIIRSFKSCSTNAALILSNSTPLDLKAFELTARHAFLLPKESFIRSRLLENPKSLFFGFEDLLPENFYLDQRQPSFFSTLPPWTAKPFLVNIAFSYLPELFPTSNDACFIFTDGSKKRSVVGYALVATCQSRMLTTKIGRLPNTTSVLDAELQAIHSALEVARDFKSDFSSFTIFTDSQGALSQLLRSRKVSSEIFNLQALATEVGQETSLCFYWVPSHRGIPGNVLADHLAKQATTLAAVEATTLSLQFLKENIQKFSQELWQAEWNNSKAGHITKLFFPTPSSARLLNETNVPQSTMQLLTGHSRLNTFLARISAVPSSLCSCEIEDESIEHFLFRCPRFADQQETFRLSLQSLQTSWPPSLNILVQTMEHFHIFIHYVTSTERLNIFM